MTAYMNRPWGVKIILLGKLSLIILSTKLVTHQFPPIPVKLTSIGDFSGHKVRSVNLKSEFLIKIRSVSVPIPCVFTFEFRKFTIKFLFFFHRR